MSSGSFSMPAGGPGNVGVFARPKPAPCPPVGGAQAQGAAPFPPCIPASPEVPAPVQPAQPGRGGSPSQIPRDATATAIPNVVAAGAKWTKIWQAGGNSADGIVPDKDGNVLVAQ